MRTIFKSFQINLVFASNLIFYAKFLSYYNFKYLCLVRINKAIKKIYIYILVSVHCFQMSVRGKFLAKLVNYCHLICSNLQLSFLFSYGLVVGTFSHQ